MAHALFGLAQLFFLFLFVAGIVYLNSIRPSGTVYRPFRIRWWASALAASYVVLALLVLLQAPYYLQKTAPAVAKRHAEGRERCMELGPDSEFSLRAELFEKEWLKDEATAPGPDTKSKTLKPKLTPSVFSVLLPFLNTLLFNTGVAIAVVPLLAQFALLQYQYPPAVTAASPSAREKVKRWWGVLLPVLNLVCVISAFTAPTFYLYVQPGRVDRCIYTSGHWFTFSATLLTFAVIVAHLASYQSYCKSSGKLLAFYVLWIAAYLMAATAVLKRTQHSFHDHVEAADGMRQALPAFLFYMLVFLGVQYATFAATAPPAQTQPEAVAAEKDVTAAPEAAPAVSLPAARPSTRSSSRTEAVSAPIPAVSPAKERGFFAPVSPIGPPDGDRSAVPPAPALDVPDAPPPPPPPAPALTSTTSGTVQRKTRSQTAAAARATAADGGAAPPPPPAPPAPSAAFASAPARSAAPADDRSDLLSQIRGGSVRLKPAAPRQGGAASANMDPFAKLMLGLRKVVQPDADDEDQEDKAAWGKEQ